MEADLQGTVESLSLAKQHGLWPVFEALQNSLDAVDERRDEKNFRPVIAIEILREERATNSSGVPAVCGAIVTDNGPGLHDRSWGAFQKIYTRHKAKVGGKGVGRLTWLKVFQEALVDSVYEDEDGVRRRRSFTFRLPSGIEDLQEQVTDQPIGTRVELSGLLPAYRDGVNVWPETVARRIVEHFLTFFVLDRGVAINLTDGGEVSRLADVYRDNLVAQAESEVLDVAGHQVQLRHFLVRGFGQGRHEARWCARERVVQNIRVSHDEVSGLAPRIDVEGQSSIYYCYVTSDVLTKAVNSERTRFSIPQRRTPISDHVSMDELQGAVQAAMGSFLEPHTTERRAEAKQRLGEVLDDAPRYRYVAEHYGHRLRTSPDWDHRRIEIELGKLQAEVEFEVRSEVNKVLAKGDQAPEEKVTQVTEQVTAAQRSDLAAYIAHRRVILDLMRTLLERNAETGGRSTEAALHRLVFPMRADSTELTGRDDEHNLWTLDERLAFYSYLASDKPFTAVQALQVAAEHELRRPDLIALDRVAAFGLGDPLDLASITLVEFKRAEGLETSRDDPVERLIDYANEIRDGKVEDQSGREVRVEPATPIFGFAVCKLTSKFERKLRQHYRAVPSVDRSWTISRPEDHLQIHVIPYRVLLRNAEKRNEVFFHKAGMPSARR